MHNDEYVSIKGDGAASVGVKLGTQYNFGEIKVDITVQLTCNQDQQTIFRGGALAYHSAKQLIDETVNQLLPQQAPLPQTSAPTYGAPR